MTALIIILAIFAIVVIWLISTYNTLVSERLKVHTQWSQIDVVLKQRADLIPNLLETVKGYAAHEKEAFQAVTDARGKYLQASGTREQMQADTALSGALGRLIAVAESYPALQANQSFLDLQRQLGDMEQRLADFRQFYNDMVMRYNRHLITIPSNLVANMFRFQEEAFFAVEEADKKAPEVKL